MAFGSSNLTSRSQSVFDEPNPLDHLLGEALAPKTPDQIRNERIAAAKAAGYPSVTGNQAQGWGPGGIPTYRDLNTFGNKNGGPLGTFGNLPPILLESLRSDTNKMQAAADEQHTKIGDWESRFNDWLGGSGVDYIAKTIAEGRQGVMPPMAAAVGTAEDVKNVANYVLSLSGSAHNSVAAQLGKSKFGACAACHGADGKGNQALGAPNLTDKVWLHGWGEAAVMAMINNGKTNVMPQHATRLSPEQIRVLAAYVWSLSHKGDKQTAMNAVNASAQ